MAQACSRARHQSRAARLSAQNAGTARADGLRTVDSTDSATLCVVVTDDGAVATEATHGTALAGRCPLCLARLIVVVESHDADAVCCACGGVVGRVYPRAVLRGGNVVSLRRRRVRGQRG